MAAAAAFASYMKKQAHTTLAYMFYK